MIVLGLDSHGVWRIRDSLRSSPRWCVGAVSHKRAAVQCRASPRVLRWMGSGLLPRRDRAGAVLEAMGMSTHAYECACASVSFGMAWAGRGVGVGAAWAAG